MMPHGVESPAHSSAQHYTSWGRNAKKSFIFFDQTMDISMVPDVCHSQELIETQMI